jgi:hypothetical protein
MEPCTKPTQSGYLEGLKERKPGIKEGREGGSYQQRRNKRRKEGRKEGRKKEGRKEGSKGMQEQ